MVIIRVDIIMILKFEYWKKREKFFLPFISLDISSFLLSIFCLFVFLSYHPPLSSQFFFHNIEFKPKRMEKFSNENAIQSCRIIIVVVVVAGILFPKMIQKNEFLVKHIDHHHYHSIILNIKSVCVDIVDYLCIMSVKIDFFLLIRLNSSSSSKTNIPIHWILYWIFRFVFSFRSRFFYCCWFLPILIVCWKINMQTHIFFGRSLIFEW